jgi:hypothetical protein
MARSPGLDTCGARSDNEAITPTHGDGDGPHSRRPDSVREINPIGENEREETMPSLTPEQRAAVEQAIVRDGHARIDDYVIVKADVYDRLRAVDDDALDMIQVGSLVESVMSEDDAGDPLLDSYQSYRS